MHDGKCRTAVEFVVEERVRHRETSRVVRRGPVPAVAPILEKMAVRGAARCTGGRDGRSADGYMYVCGVIEVPPRPDGERYGSDRITQSPVVMCRRETTWLAPGAGTGSDRIERFWSHVFCALISPGARCSKRRDNGQQCQPHDISFRLR